MKRETSKEVIERLKEEGVISEVPIPDDDEPMSLLLEHPDPLLLEGEGSEYIEPSLTQEELIQLKWQLFGKCPICHENVKGYSAGPFNAQHYRSLQDEGIDALTGHKQTCSQKWRKA